MPSTKVPSTGNLLKHYHALHKSVAKSQSEAKQQSVSQIKPDFFRKYSSRLRQDKARKLALDLIVSINLKLSPFFSSFC